MEAVDEVGTSFTQFKLQKAPWDLRYIVYVIQVGPLVWLWCVLCIGPFCVYVCALVCIHV